MHILSALKLSRHSGSRTTFRSLLRVVNPHLGLSKVSLGVFSGTAFIGLLAIAGHSQPVLHSSNTAVPAASAWQQPPTISELNSFDFEHAGSSSSQAQQFNNSAAGSAAQSDHTEDTNSSAHVNINGQNIGVNGNGSVHKTIDTGNGTTQVDIDVKTNGQGNASSSTNVHSFSSSTSSSNVTANKLGGSN